MKEKVKFGPLEIFEARSFQKFFRFRNLTLSFTMFYTKNVWKTGIEDLKEFR